MYKIFVGAHYVCARFSSGTRVGSLLQNDRNFLKKYLGHN